MLILTRRVGETLMIGDDVTVTVLGVKGNQVRIGVGSAFSRSATSPERRQSYHDFSKNKVILAGANCGSKMALTRFN